MTRDEMKDKIEDIIFSKAIIHNEYGEDFCVENFSELAEEILNVILGE